MNLNTMLSSVIFLVRRHPVSSPLRRVSPGAVAAVLAGYLGSPVLADAPPARPTADEVHTIEAKVRLPRGAAALSKYVRYYYASAITGGRTVSGIYVAKFWVRSADIPPDGIVIVGSESEIQVPSDAECSVLVVQAEPSPTGKISASCTSGVIDLLKRK